MKKKLFNLGNIKNLTKSQYEVLKALLLWNYSKKATIVNLVNKTNYSFCSVNIALTTLKERGIVKRSKEYGYFIPDEIKKLILSEVKLSELIDNINRVELDIKFKDENEKINENLLKEGG
ncbi:MAG: hypothetical protein QXG18_02730 [Candidatus Pacearchaeota archaeon]